MMWMVAVMRARKGGSGGGNRRIVDDGWKKWQQHTTSHLHIHLSFFVCLWKKSHSVVVDLFSSHLFLIYNCSDKQYYENIREIHHAISCPSLETTKTRTTWMFDCFSSVIEQTTTVAAGKSSRWDIVAISHGCGSVLSRSCMLSVDVKAFSIFGIMLLSLAFIPPMVHYHLFGIVRRQHEWYSQHDSSPFQ